jgi:hypothetical protein
MIEVLQETVAAAVPSPRSGSTLFVSSALATWTTNQPEMFVRDFQINDTCYRRLDPEYYAWLRSRMHMAKMAAAAGRILESAFGDLRAKFNAVHKWAVERHGEAGLIEAANGLNVRDYRPPLAEPWLDQPSGSTGPDTSEHHAVSEDATALVDAIYDRAQALGWNHNRLYCVPATRRSVIAVDGGLVCYLRAGGRIGEVTRQSIEIIGAPPLEVRQHFYNPDVDQPWTTKVGTPQ